MSGTNISPGHAQIVATLQDLQRAIYATATTATFKAPAFSALPVVTAADAGRLAFHATARNPGQGVGAGTGCLCCVTTAGIWVAVWSGVAPTV